MFLYNLAYEFNKIIFHTQELSHTLMEYKTDDFLSRNQALKEFIDVYQQQGTNISMWFSGSMTTWIISPVSDIEISYIIVEGDNEITPWELISDLEQNYLQGIEIDFFWNFYNLEDIRKWLSDFKEIGTNSILNDNYTSIFANFFVISKYSFYVLWERHKSILSDMEYIFNNNDFFKKEVEMKMEWLLSHESLLSFHDSFRKVRERMNDNKKFSNLIEKEREKILLEIEKHMVFIVLSIEKLL